MYLQKTKYGSTLKTDRLQVEDDLVRVYDKDIAVPEGTKSIRIKIDVNSGNGSVYVEFQPMNQKHSIGVINNKLAD